MRDGSVAPRSGRRRDHRGLADPLTCKRRRTTYRITLEEARERYVDAERVPYSVELRQVNERAPGHGQTLRG